MMFDQLPTDTLAMLRSNLERAQWDESGYIDELNALGVRMVDLIERKHAQQAFVASLVDSIAKLEAANA